VTAGGRGGNVLIVTDVDGPLPDTLDGVIVNVYGVFWNRPVNVQVVPDTVCVGSDKDSTVYWVAFRAEFHTRVMVVSVLLEDVKPVTTGGRGRGGRLLIERIV
jgi:hypothetical protein